PISVNGGVTEQQGEQPGTAVNDEGAQHQHSVMVQGKSKPGKSNPTIEGYQAQAYRSALELMTKLGLDPFVEKSDDGLGFFILPVHNTQQVLKGTHRRYYVYLVNLFVITCTNCTDAVTQEKARSLLPFSIDDYLEHVYHEHDAAVPGHALQMMVND